VYLSQRYVPLMKVSTDDGKYTVIQDSTGGMRALRYGEEWRDCTGDGMILTLAQDLQDARAEIQRLKDKIDDDHQYISGLTAGTFGY